MSDFDGIILDNFPNNQADYVYLNNIYDKEKPFMFIEGYNLNPKYIINFNDNLKFNLGLESNFSKSLFLNNEVNISDISSSFNIFLNSSDDYLESYLYNNNSIYQLRSNNFLGLYQI